MSAQLPMSHIVCHVVLAYFLAVWPQIHVMLSIMAFSTSALILTLNIESLHSNLIFSVPIWLMFNC